MYEYQGLQDIYFIMLYGGATALALASCIYLLFRRGNAFTSVGSSPRQLRLWTAAFMVAVVGSHVWWSLLGTLYLTDDRLIRNIVAITLDRLTFVPLVMCVLLRMLQDRPRPLWPVAAAFVPLAVFSFYCLVAHCDYFELVTECYSLLTGLAFLIYYVYAVRQYGHWLRDNYADLEHKEVWGSLLLFAMLLFSYVGYASNEGDLVGEYLAQINTVVIIAFLLWRVETLQELIVPDETAQDDLVEDAPVEEMPVEQVTIPASDKQSSLAVIDSLLKKRCEKSRIYLQHDLTLQQLADALGTNRTYLGRYFAQQGITYNAYINGLRIEHFMRLYQQAIATHRNVSALRLSYEAGFRSYSTFSSAFRQYKGMTASQWIRRIS